MLSSCYVHSFEQRAFLQCIGLRAHQSMLEVSTPALEVSTHDATLATNVLNASTTHKFLNASTSHTFFKRQHQRQVFKR